jgi:hypothetical protein
MPRVMETLRAVGTPIGEWIRSSCREPILVGIVVNGYDCGNQWHVTFGSCYGRMHLTLFTIGYDSIRARLLRSYVTATSVNQRKI